MSESHNIPCPAEKFNEVFNGLSPYLAHFFTLFFITGRIDRSKIGNDVPVIADEQRLERFIRFVPGSGFIPRGLLSAEHGAYRKGKVPLRCLWRNTTMVNNAGITIAIAIAAK